MKSDAVSSATSEIKITGVSVRRTGDTTHRRQVLRAKVVLFRTASTEFKDMSGGPLTTRLLNHLTGVFGMSV